MFYDVGDTVRASVVFRNISTGAAADPTTITVTIVPPYGTPVTYTYGGGQIVKDSTGNYHTDLVITTAGRWWVTWTGTGAITASTDTNFLVNAGAG